MTDASGLVVVDKPGGLTSHDVVARVRRLAGTRKVGHAGTLDPMATGVLVLGLNRATRLLGHLMLTEKKYDATIRLGASTTTDDAEGEVVATAPTDHLTEEDVLAGLAQFVGDIEQVPSSVSAIKVDGKRAYDLVRAGEQVELDAATGQRRLDRGCTRSWAPDVRVSVQCSSGTYIRAIARDLGERLGTGGHLTALRRTAVGAFDLDVRAHPRATSSRRSRSCRSRRRPGPASPAATSTRSSPPTSGSAASWRSTSDATARWRCSRPTGSSSRSTRATARPPGRSRSSPRTAASSLLRVRIWRSLDDVPADLGRTVVVIGNFDGVHLGHRHVVSRARELADRDGLRLVAVTFDPHPMAVLRPEHAPLTLTDVDRRSVLLAQVGVDDVFVIPFSREIAAWSPEEFIDRVLVDGLHAAAVVVGANFRFGAKAAGDVATLAAAGRVQGFEVVGLALDGGPQVWSSTYVRTCLAAGDVEGAAEALGRPYSVVGHVVRGDKRGRELGYPTANVPTGGTRRSRGRGVRRVADPARLRRAASRCPRRSASAPTPPSTVSASAGWRPTSSTGRTSSSTTSRWRSPSWRTSAGWCASRGSRR